MYIDVTGCDIITDMQKDNYSVNHPGNISERKSRQTRCTCSELRGYARIVYGDGGSQPLPRKGKKASHLRGSVLSVRVYALLSMLLFFPHLMGDADVDVWFPPHFSNMPLEYVTEGDVAGITPPNGWKWIYFANHTHTEYSDGQGDVEGRIKEAARFGADIVSITDHRTMDQCDDPEFVPHDGCIPMRGVEWGGGGHAGILNMTGTDPLNKKPDGTGYTITETIPLALARGGSIFINHPCYSTLWPHSFVHAGIKGIEVWTTNFPDITESGAARAWWSGMVAQGSILVAIGGSDNHVPNWLCTNISNSNTPCNRVLAASSQPGDVMDGVNAGRLVVNTPKGGPHAYLWCDQNGDGIYETPMGDTVPVTSLKRLRFRVEVREGQYSTLTVFSLNGSIERSIGSGNPWRADFEADVRPDTKDFFRAEIKSVVGAIQCVTNPIYINYTPGDADSDGASDALEQAYGLPFYHSDADGDGVRDGFETGYDGNLNAYTPWPYGEDMNANSNDTDGDGVYDADELSRGTNPLRPNRILTMAVECRPELPSLNTVVPAPGPHEYSEGDQVSLQAISDLGWRFSHWEVIPTEAMPPAAPEEANTTISIDVTKTVKAIFVKTYSLITTVFPEGAGTVVGAGTYDNGTTVMLEATPTSGYRFDHWEGDAEGVDNPVYITMTTDKAVMAVFVELDPEGEWEGEPPVEGEGEPAEGELEGEGEGESIEGEIEGEGEQQLSHPADLNNDFRIVISEAVAYLAGWQQGTNPIGYAIRAAYLWQNGEQYIYDENIAPPLCWMLIP